MRKRQQVERHAAEARRAGPRSYRRWRSAMVGCQDRRRRHGRRCLFPGRTTGACPPHHRRARGCVLAGVGHRCRNPDRARASGTGAGCSRSDRSIRRSQYHGRQEPLERPYIRPVQCGRGALGNVADRALVRSGLQSRQPATCCGVFRRCCNRDGHQPLPAPRSR